MLALGLSSPGQDLALILCILLILSQRLTTNPVNACQYIWVFATLNFGFPFEKSDTQSNQFN